MRSGDEHGRIGLGMITIELDRFFRDAYAYASAYGLDDPEATEVAGSVIVAAGLRASCRNREVGEFDAGADVGGS